MEGVILFADNKVFEDKSFEHELFEMLRSDTSLSVLPISSLSDLERTLETISTFKALILDWNFEKDMVDLDMDGIELPATTPEEMLENLNIYSLIYIYSQTEIPLEAKKKFKDKFSNKIQFKKKGSPDQVNEDYENIKTDIERFVQVNKHMEIPFIWSHAINRSVQQIFSELEQADPNWIKEIRDTSIKEGGEPTSEIIDIFHHLLAESLIQNEELRNALNSYQCDDDNKEDENTAKLYRRIYYSRLVNDAPIMTGDIFRFNESEYGILITPECDISSSVEEKNYFEFLIVNKDLSIEYQDKKKKAYTKNKSIADVFNNKTLSSHILISFPFEDEKYDNLAYIDFKSAIRVFARKDVNGIDIIKSRSQFKLNSPYIHQLRQRFISFIGRYGVPAIPQSLRAFNLR